jgi:uncharacterized repeat protein (TIGR01451 family)
MKLRMLSKIVAGAATAGLGIMTAFVMLPMITARASASDAVISSAAGPIHDIYLSAELDCQVRYSTDTSFEWYPPTASIGDCGTSAALNGTLYGYNYQNSSFGATLWTPVSQTGPTGTGAATDPFKVVTVVRNPAGVMLTQTDSYVTGDDYYSTSVVVDNASGVRQTGTLYSAGDCYLGNSDSGYGIITGTSPACSKTPPPPSGRVEQLVPVTAGNSYFEGAHSLGVNTLQHTLSSYPDTCQCNTLLDNEEGISWPLDLSAGATAKFGWETAFSLTGHVPVILSSSADSPVTPASGTNGYRVTLANNNTAAATVDSVSVTLPPGFVYQSGTTSGLTGANPTITGDITTGFTLTWHGPFLLPEASEKEIHFKVTVSEQPGTYTIDTSATAGTPVHVAPETAAAPITVTPLANLAITKGVIASTVSAGTGTLFFLTVKNLGPDTATDVVVSDKLPDGLAFVSATPSVCSVLPGNEVECHLGDLVNGAATLITLHVVADADTFPGIRVNTATVSSATPDPDELNNESKVDVIVKGQENVSITKTGTATVVAGDPVTYDLTVINSGPSAATVTVRDILPPGLTFVSITGPGCPASPATPECSPHLAVGAPVTLAVTADSSPDLPAGTVLTDRAEVSYLSDDTNVIHDTSFDTVVTTHSDLALTKRLDTPSPIVAGTTAVYTLSATDNGPSTANGVDVTDTLPAGTTFDPGASSPGCSAGPPVTCTVGSLARGETSEVRVAVFVPASAAAASKITNTATVSAPDSTSATATVTDPVSREADLAIWKSPLDNPVTAGGVLTYALTVHNYGPSDAADVHITDTQPADVTFDSATVSNGGACTTISPVLDCTVPALAAGDSAVVDITATVLPSAAPGSQIENIASVSSAEPDPNAANNTSPSYVTVVNPPALTLSKDASTVPATAGAALDYTLMATNNGGSAATGVVLTDPIPANYHATAATASPHGTCTVTSAEVSCDLGTIGPHDSVTVTIDGDVLATASAGSVIANRAQVTDDQHQTALAYSDTSVRRVSSLTVTKIATTPTVTAGGTATWQVEVANDGPSEASGVVVYDSPPAGVTLAGLSGPGAVCSVPDALCTIAALPAHGAIVITVTGTVAPDATGTITNTAKATWDGNSTGVSDTAPPVGVTQHAVLRVTKTGPATAAAGEPIVYQVQVHNDGPSIAPGTTVTDTLPAGLTFDAALSSAGCAAVGQMVTCPVGELEPAGTETVYIGATIPADNPSGPVTDTALAAADDAAPVSAMATTSIRHLSAVSVGKSAPEGIAGDDLTWTIPVTNGGPSAAVGWTVADTLPADLGSFVSATVPGGRCTEHASTVRCTLPDLAVGETVEVSVTTHLSPSLVPDHSSVVVTNEARLGVPSDATDPLPRLSLAATGDTTVTALAHLVPSKTASPNPVVAGTHITYTLHVRNDGPSDATSSVVSDVLPPEVTFVASDSDKRCALVTSVQGVQAEENTVECRAGTLGPGDDATFTVTGLVSAATGDGSVTVNSDYASSSAPDPHPDDPKAVTTDVIARYRLTITKTATRHFVFAGQYYKYRITVTNHGPSAAFKVGISDGAPKSVLQLGLKPGPKIDATCPVVGIDFRCTVPEIMPGGSVTITMTVRVKPDTASGKVIVNTATVTGAHNTNHDHHATARVIVYRESTARVAKTPSVASVRPGGKVVWTVAVRDEGPSLMVKVLVIDRLPADLTFVAAGSSRSCSAKGQLVTCRFGSIALDKTADFLIATKVASNARGRIRNTALAEAQNAFGRHASGSVRVVS